MANSTPAHDYLLPRITALIAEAVKNGIAGDVAVAVLTDILTSPGFDTAVPDPHADSAPRQDWERGPDAPVVIDGASAAGAPAIGAQEAADFVRPLRWGQ